MVVLRRYDDQRVSLAHLGGKVGLLNNYFLEREIEQEQKKAEYVLKPAA